MQNIVTPVDVNTFEKLLTEEGYDETETQFLVNGFRYGFELCYQGKIEGIKRTTPNLRLRIGNETVLWNKIMKEVKLGRFTGPFREAPFESYIQSPIGLVPKDGGTDARLIFHLSYPRSGESINSGTPKELMSVSYPDFSEAIGISLKAGKSCGMGKSDYTSAFRNLGI